MAQHLNIPVAFKWRSQPAAWKVVTAEVTGWALESAQAEPHFQAKVEERDTRYLLEVPWWALPEPTLRLLEQEKAREFERSYSLELLVCCAEAQNRKKWEANPWPMREEFLRLKRDTKALLAFLNRWGAWGPTRTSVPAPAKVEIPLAGRLRLDLPPVDLDPSKLPAAIRAIVFGAANAESTALDHKVLNYLFPFEIWQFQNHCRDALKKPAHEWLTTQKLLALLPRHEYPHYVLTASGCQRAVLDTITIDFLRKVKFRLCARPDCRTPFPIESRHRREYCCQYCAHIESVRRQRRKAKKEALQGKEMTYAKR
jgi:hypothetical protein